MTRSLVKDSLVYALGVVLGRLAGFIMIPVYTRLFTPADYGVLETVSRLVDIFGLILSLGLAGALLRYYNTATADSDRRALISSAMILMIAVTALGIAVLFPITPLLTRLTFGDTQYAALVRISLLESLLSAFIWLPLTISRAQGRPWRFTVFSLLHLSTVLLLNAVLVVYLRLGLLGVMLSALLGTVIWGTILAVSVFRVVGLHFVEGWARQLLTYGIPLVPALVAQFTLHFSDRFFLVRYASVEELGLYSLAYRFAMLVAVFYSILDNAWWPWAFRVATMPGGDRQLREGGAFLLAASAAFCSGVILFAEPGIKIVAAQPFWGAARYVPPLALAYWLFTTQAPFSLGSRLAKRTDVFALANTVAALICLGLSLWLIPRYQAWGAVATTLASFALLAGFVLYSSHMVRPLRHKWSVAAVSLTGLVVAAALNSAMHSTFTIDLLLRGVLWLAITIGLFWWLPLPSLPGLRRIAAS